MEGKSNKAVMGLIFYLAAVSAVARGEEIDRTKGTPDKTVIQMKAKPPIQSFDLAEVRLLDGPFKHAMDLNHEYLLKLEPDRFLARFRKEAGLIPKAEGYSGWENDTISGHSLGHYLSALSLMYRASGDMRLLGKVDYIVTELAEIQKANGDGYVAAIPRGREILSQVARGDIHAKGFDLNGLWVPFYVLHKEMAGLRDTYRLCGNLQALAVECSLAGWIEKTVSGLSHDQMQQVLACEHGGINEVLADLFADTGDPRYIALSRRFHDEAVLDPLAQKQDIMPGRHGNTNIPKLIGLARRYEIEGDPADRAAAEFFWDRVVHHHSYVTGGHGINEYLGPPDRLSDRLGPNTTESCNVYNMLRLTEHIFSWKGEAATADFYERALYNHILASQNPQNGRVVYNLSLAMGWYKEFQDPFNDFTCCVGTGMENHSKYGEAIYFHEGDRLYVNLFIASELNWKEKGVKLRQETSFPDGEKTHLTVYCQKPVALGLRIRHPHWARGGFQAALNGRVQPDPYGPSSYLEIRRVWKSGDAVEIQLPMHLRLESMPDDPNRIALFAGPILLAGDLGPVADPAAEQPDYVPVLVTGNRPPEEWLEPVAGEVLTYKTKDTGRPHEVVLRPFFRIYDRRYTVYWDAFTEGGWQEKEAEYKVEAERRLHLEAMTVDICQPGEMQSERAHNLQGERTEAGEFYGRKFRRTSSCGWFAFDMKILPGQPLALVATYWGNESGARTFDIMVDGKSIASQTLKNDRPGRFFDVTYSIPDTLVKGKTKVTVTFKPRPDNSIGGLFRLRLVKNL